MELIICVTLFREEVTTEKQMHIFIFNNMCDLNASEFLQIINLSQRLLNYKMSSKQNILLLCKP